MRAERNRPVQCWRSGVIDVLGTITRSARRGSVAPRLNDEIHSLRTVDNTTNLIFLVREYACVAAVIGGAVAFAEFRARWGVHWSLNIPVFALAIALVGGLQHRLAGLGHEASHHTFMKNRRLNDLVADVLCMFPILATVHFYRLFHLAHHQYTNDPERDPDLVNMGRSKDVDSLPMPKLKFVLLYFLRIFLRPVAFARYQWDYLYVNTLGKGGNVYMRRVPGGDAESRWPRIGTWLGLVHVFGLNGLLFLLSRTGRANWITSAAAVSFTLAVVGPWLLPNRWMYQSPFREAYSSRLAACLRLAYYTVLIFILAKLRIATDGRSAMYVALLWIVPMMTSFSAYLLLRDVYQHANADSGRLTNSRVFFADPFTRWAVFVYGQDMHVTHHLYPTIPHYRLPSLHGLLKRHDHEYCQKVVECDGVFGNRSGLPTILDVMSKSRDRAPLRVRAQSVRRGGR